MKPSPSTLAKYLHDADVCLRQFIKASSRTRSLRGSVQVQRAVSAIIRAQLELDDALAHLDTPT